MTAKLKLHPTPEQFQALRQTQLAYRNALNAVSCYAFAHGKMSSGRALQRECYDLIRGQYGLPAQMACNVPRQVGVTYKGLWTKVKHNAAQRKAGITKKRYKGLDQPPKYVSPTLTYNFHRDYSLKENAHYSSLACPRCGHTADANRPHKGLLFVCQHCHYSLHADLVGARNVTMRTLLIRQDWVRTGVLSIRPDVSDTEAKAARLARYAELRWSLDTSPLSLDTG